MDRAWIGTRASDEDRADVANLLREAAAEGRLTMEELSERVSEVMTSRTYGDLQRCLRELPCIDTYKPWQKVRRSEVQVVSASTERHRSGLGLMIPVIVGIMGLLVLSALSGLVTSLILLPIRVILYVVLIVILFRVARFFLRLSR